mmetsp:Transcript_16189/g.39456  ORF Transcript_16189/g.39456 Transcript_16189/m.39456 type:complete len:150 (+) Transcript_16189:249-698(+)|eukprot:CAMPEP_0206257476 /NCGR_PEP_ID=MMETSP0047_2-20121206/25363_1 /ASSEMBLY_ACC=CAM_ASM_000192 /TAXON_ID=195065 /ORGANISM="Chroomonas mesostigmatica_cf, Strain CCMP1168" /LENGTH=149 /DNA_ID=CAMNT_0053684069 /DNA_START=183 /DNA_END=632 /DNA_ORIENTATION=-
MAEDLRSTKCMVRELPAVWEALGAVGGHDQIRVWLQGDIVQLLDGGSAHEPSEQSHGCLDDATGTVLVNFKDIYETFDKYNPAKYRIPLGAYVRVVGELVQDGDDLVVVATSLQDLSAVPDSFSLWLTEVLDVRGARMFDPPASFFRHG